MEVSGNGLGLWLKEVCAKDKLSLRAAGERAGLSHSTIRDIANGNTPNPDTIKKLAIAFSGGNHHGQVLEDKLLALAGHRAERQEDNISEPLARLMDTIGDFSERQVKMLTRFADFLKSTEPGR